MHKVRLLYFKQTGKYYSDGEYETVHDSFHDVVKEIKQMKIDGNLPGLVEGCREFIILLETQEPWGVPHIIA